MSNNLTEQEKRLLEQFRLLKAEDQGAIANAIRISLAEPEPTPPTAEAPFDAHGCATSTNEKDRNGYVSRRAIHLREAFAVIGALIGQGELAVDLGNADIATGWFNSFDVWVTIAARTLDMLDY